MKQGKLWPAMALFAVVLASCSGGASSEDPTTEDATASPAGDSTTTDAETSDVEEDPSAADGEPVVIGAMGPTTGPAATVGVALIDPLEMWAEQVGEAGVNGHPIELIVCNDEAQPERAVSCMREFAAEEVDMIAQFSLTGSINASLPLVQDEGPIMFLASPNAAPSGDEYPFVYQASPTSRALTEALANYLVENDVTRVGMVAATDASGEVAVTDAQEVFGEAGLDLVVERIDLEATDAGTQLASIADQDVGVIYSAYTGGGAAAIVNSYSDLGLEVPLVVNYGNLSDAFLESVEGSLPPRLFGIAVKGLVADALDDPEAVERREQFASDFEDQYGRRIDMINLLGHYVTDAIHSVIENADDPTDRDSIKQYLESGPIESVQTLSWDESEHVGLGPDAVTVVELKDGSWALPDPIG